MTCGRVHGLVGGDEHEGLDPAFHGRFRGVVGREDIVVNALDHVVFDDGHVLVRGRVINRLDRQGGNDFAHAMLVVCVAQQCHELDGIAKPGIDGAQLAFDLVESELRRFQQYQPPGTAPMLGGRARNQSIRPRR